MRECRAPRDWSLLALQNVRTGKSHYLVICRCPEEYVLGIIESLSDLSTTIINDQCIEFMKISEGPMSHDQPTYASVPGIRVYGMMCVQPTRSTQSTIGIERYKSIYR